MSAGRPIIIQSFFGLMLIQRTHNFKVQQQKEENLI
jgi:hypothetical protein